MHPKQRQQGTYIIDTKTQIKNSVNSLYKKEHYKIITLVVHVFNTYTDIG